ncbi:MAG: hypothetical protein FWF88_12060 [Peptococcaceae bacterium]|nr:hypothetical protein [Peptococcaceae bacterium]
MATDYIDPDTVEDCALTIKREIPVWYESILSCHQTLLKMVEDGVWQEEEAENLVDEFEKIIINQFAIPRANQLNQFADHLLKVADNARKRQDPVKE